MIVIILKNILYFGRKRITYIAGYKHIFMWFFESYGGEKDVEQAASLFRRDLAHKNPLLLPFPAQTFEEPFMFIQVCNFSTHPTTALKSCFSRF
jgi:hypothetical protein